MSIFLDSKSGKWFNTLDELKAFQKGEPKKGSPVSYKKETVKQEVEKEVVIEEESSTEETVEEASDKKDEMEFDNGGIRINIPPDDMREQLKDAGVDARAFARKNDQDLAEFYFKFFNNK